MFIRVFRPLERKEVLINVNHISMIEVKYAVPSSDGNFYTTSLEQGVTNPEAVRVYQFHVAGEKFTLPSDPNDPVMMVFEEIYKNAVKGQEPNTLSDEDE